MKKDRHFAGLFFEATMGFEPMMRVLQTLALPLGDVARYITFWLARNGSPGTNLPAVYWKTRAGDGIRTHDLLLGKETYYRCTTPAFFGFLSR
jgi:hypothetical protein